jgi:hypothetical protein
MTTIQTINLGNYANDGTGDDLRAAFTKVNANFSALNGAVQVSGGTNLGAGAGIFKDVNGVNLEFKTLTSVDNSVTLTSSSNTVDLHVNTLLVNDHNPTLGGNLNLNNQYVYGGDVQTTVYGYDITILHALVEIMLETGKLSVDFGSLLSPTGNDTNFRGYTFDMGTFAYTPPNNQINFGTFV